MSHGAGTEADSAGLLKPGRNCWQVERANRASFLIDNGAYLPSPTRDAEGPAIDMTAGTLEDAVSLGSRLLAELFTLALIAPQVRVLVAPEPMLLRRR